MTTGDTETRLKLALGDLNLNESVKSIEQIPGDLSPRRYFRCILNKAVDSIGSNSLMAMVFDSVVPPESETKLVYTSDVAFLELADFFNKHGVAVPRIFNDRKDIGVILLEDLGSDTLISLLKADRDQAFNYYKTACSTIISIQGIKGDQSSFPFSRALENDVFKRETESFRKYFLTGTLIDGPALEACIDLVCNEVASFKKVLVHRDFHSWNLLIDRDKKLRVIDFQDALMGPRTYDLVAFLHERDVDSILSNAQIEELEDFYFSHYSDSLVREFEYPRVQLQRDIKTTGLFKRCVVERGLPSYGEWIPGNIKRMIATLECLKAQDSRYEVLFKFVSSIKG